MIPLRRLAAIPMVRPTLSIDLSKQEQEFVHGYREGASVFYVTTTYEEGQKNEVIDVDRDSWGPFWRAKNKAFSSFLLSIPEVAGFSNLMFYVCDGNQKRQALLNHIERLHKTDESWHYLVDSIIFDTKGKLGLVMQDMHYIKK